MNKVLGLGSSADEEGERSKTAHPFAEQENLAAKAALNQVRTFWRELRLATKKSAPAIGTIEGPTGSFS